MIDPVKEVVNPPEGLAILAALDAAAMTEGSSVTMGIITSSPLILKFSATPIGNVYVPMTFSTILSARSTESDGSAIFFASSSEMPVSATTFAIRSAGESL